MAVGKKKKGYLEGSNMDMGMELVYMEIEDFDRTEWVGLQALRKNCGKMDFDKQFAAGQAV